MSAKSTDAAPALPQRSESDDHIRAWTRVRQGVTSQASPPPPRSKRERASDALGVPPLRQIMRRLPRWPGILILNYHRLGDREARPWDRAVFNGDGEMFESQLAALSRCADIVSLADLPELVGRGRRGRTLLLTFDDGYRDNFEIAYPILRRYGATAAFFVATGFLDRPVVPWWDEISWMVRSSTNTALIDIPETGVTLSLARDDAEETTRALIAHYKQLDGADTDGYLWQIASGTGSGRCDAAAAQELWMDWDMIREMRDSGMDIGGHTVNHPVLANLSAEEQQAEVRGCADRLSSELGEPMRAFAYPVGGRDSFTPTTRRVVAEQGVDFAFSFYGGFAGFEGWTPMDVPRVHVPYGATPVRLEAMLGLPRLFARH